MKKGTALVLVCLLLLSGCGRTAGTVTFQDRTFRKADLSSETIDWLAWYNALPQEEQLAISYIPADLYALLDYDSAGDAPVETE